jgi:TetR/AcrR family transcriptional repressor of nem operon
MTDFRTAILDAAEKRIRSAGFNGFSFREVATDVGIKSASVHYHFPTKEDLGVAVGQRYLVRFLDELGPPDDERALAEKLQRLRAMFRQSMTEQELMCLCGMLASEVSGLPARVASSTRAFFIGLRGWISAAFARANLDQADIKANQIVAMLEGGLILARADGDIAAFDKAALLLDEIAQREAGH